MDKCTCCEGTGKVACKTCNGEGKVACSVCGGSGREISVCPTCTKGYVPDPRSFDDEPTLKCPDCHGEWQKDVGLCKACNGTGKMQCESCVGIGNVSCDLCAGTGGVDIESMCKNVIDVAVEFVHHCDEDIRSLSIHKERVNSDMASAIFEAAKRGVGVAAYVASALCDDYENLAGGKEDWEYLNVAADIGNNMVAQYMRAIMNDSEWEKENWEDIKKSAAQGFVPALEVMATVYYNSESEDDECCSVNWNKSLECWKRILEVKDRDDWNARTIEMARLHVKNLPNIINGDVHSMIELGKSLLEMKCDGYKEHTYRSPTREGKLWLQEAELRIGVGDCAVARDLAELYWKMKDKKYDDKALKLCKRMADGGDTISQSVLGERLRRGDGVEKDARMAFVYLYRAAKNGNVEALRRLAHLYRDGEYASKSRCKANELYARAAKYGDGWSLFEIGKCYLDGNEVKKDEVEAKRLLKLAADKGVEKAKMALSTISDSVKIKDNGPSGIVVGKPDKGSLPKFVCEDYKNAELGKPAVKASEKKSSSGSVRTSTKKRWKFVVLGLLLGFFGIHLAYAKRWFLFLLLWAGFITGNVMSDPKKETTNVSPEVVAEQVQSESKSDKESSNPISGIGIGVWALLWIGGTLFIKKDGKGNRM